MSTPTEHARLVSTSSRVGHRDIRSGNGMVRPGGLQATVLELNFCGFYIFYSWVGHFGTQPARVHVSVHVPNLGFFCTLQIAVHRN